MLNFDFFYTAKPVYNGRMRSLEKISAIIRCLQYRGFHVIFMGIKIREFSVFRVILQRLVLAKIIAKFVKFNFWLIVNRSYSRECHAYKDAWRLIVSDVLLIREQEKTMNMIGMLFLCLRTVFKKSCWACFV